MSGTPSVPMDPDFAAWLTPSDLSNDVSRRSARWFGVQAVIAELTPTLTESIVRLATRSKQKADPTVVTELRDLFSSSEEELTPVPNDEELTNLSSAVLALVLKQNSQLAATVALCVYTTSLRGRRTFSIPLELAEIAKDTLRRISSDQRRRRKPPLIPGKSSVEFTTKTKKALETSNWEAVGTAFSAAETSIQSAFGETLRASADLTTYVEGIVAIQDEELQMLWWLIGERSFDLDRPFKEVPEHPKPLLFAKELADLTGLVPGPVSLQSLLCKAGLTDDPGLVIADAIESCPSEWMERTLKSLSPSPVTHPIHFGMLRRGETGQGGAWIPGWAATVDVPADLKMSPLALATQFYRERLLIR